MDKQKPGIYYNERIIELTSTISRLKKKALILSWLRLFSFLATIAAGWLLWPEGLIPAFTGVIAALIFFIIFVNRDLDNKIAIENENKRINKKANWVIIFFMVLEYV